MIIVQCLQETFADLIESGSFATKRFVPYLQKKFLDGMKKKDNDWNHRKTKRYLRRDTLLPVNSLMRIV
jgi:hypothetical protein